MTRTTIPILASLALLLLLAITTTTVSAAPSKNLVVNIPSPSKARGKGNGNGNGNGNTNNNLEPQTRDTGAWVGENDVVATAGIGGPQILADVHHVEKMSNFDHERMPERVVHPRGTGAHGVFTSEVNFSNYTSMSLFQNPGTSVETFVRFSLVIGSKGVPETQRDPRGFAVKFYTEEGNWDLVGNNLPMFFIRSSMKFPDMVHSLKPDPIRNVQDPNRFFDFFSLTPESTNMLTNLYSDQGIPKSYRMMDGNGVHAYKFVTEQGKVTYVKFNWKSNQGVANLTVEEAAELQSRDINHLTNDLYDNIEQGNFPSWDLRVQLLAPEDLNNFEFDPLDATKVWPEELFPFIKIGSLKLNKVPSNFFQFTEQSAFCPANTVRGIEHSEDQLLQGRLFSYVDTQLHRFGSSNFKQLPVNRPRSPVRNNFADGLLNAAITKRSVNYGPSRIDPAFTAVPSAKLAEIPLVGTVTQTPINKTLNFKQAGDLYRSFDMQQRANLVKNLAGDLGQVTYPEIKNTMCAHFYMADMEYGSAIIDAAGCNRDTVKSIAAGLEE